MSKRKADRDATASKTKMEVDGDDDDGSDTDTSMINVDFEFFGLNSEIDFKGLKMLLKQLLDVDNELFNLSQLADLLLAQADHVGTAIKCDGEETDPYAIISVLNLQQHKDDDTVKQITNYFSSRTSSNAQIKAVLSNSKAKLGLIVSERFINMPHQIVPALYRMLQREMSLGGNAFDFTHLLLLSKTYVEVQSTLDSQEDRPQKKSRQTSKTAETFYFHPEDEVFQKHAVAAESYEYQKESDAGLSDSKRAFQEAGIKPQGHLIILEASKLGKAVEAVAEYLGAE